MISEILCHDLAHLRDPLLFSEEARLVNQGKPTKALCSTVMKAFGLSNGDSIYSCSKAHLDPAGSCTKGDVACLKGYTGPHLQACQIWVNVEVNTVVYTLVSMWELVSLDDQGSSATVRKKQDAIFIKTSEICCCLPFCHFEGDTFKVLVPLQMR